MKFFGAVAAALVICSAYASPVLAQEGDEWSEEEASASEMLLEAAITALDEKFDRRGERDSALGF